MFAPGPVVYDNGLAHPLGQVLRNRTDKYMGGLVRCKGNDRMDQLGAEALAERNAGAAVCLQEFEEDKMNPKLALHMADRIAWVAKVTRVTWAILAAAVLLAPADSNAQNAFPVKPIRLITYTSPGGALDIVARTIAHNLTLQMKQSVVVENRTGAGGNIGADLVAKSAPDGYTIGMATIATHGINPSLYGTRMPFDPIRDFAPITLAAEMKNVVVVNPSLPAKNIPELVAYARANPGKISFGSAGTGSSQHLAGELFKSVAGVNIVHVPYKGAANAVPDLISGQVQLMFAGNADVLTHISSGKLRAIGVASLQRSPTLPDVPTVAEQGYPGFDVRAWFGVVAPAGTSRDIVGRYNREIVAALARPEVRERLANIGMDAITSTPEEFAAFIAAEIAKWTPLVKASGAKVE